MIVRQYMGSVFWRKFRVVNPEKKKLYKMLEKQDYNGKAIFTECDGE